MRTWEAGLFVRRIPIIAFQSRYGRRAFSCFDDTGIFSPTVHDVEKSYSQSVIVRYEFQFWDEAPHFCDGPFFPDDWYVLVVAFILLNSCGYSSSSLCSDTIAA